MSQLIWIVLSIILGMLFLFLVLGANPFGSEANTTFGHFALVGLAVGSLLHGVLNAFGLKPGKVVSKYIFGQERTQKWYNSNSNPISAARDDVRGTEYYIAG